MLLGGESVGPESVVVLFPLTRRPLGSLEDRRQFKCSVLDESRPTPEPPTPRRPYLTRETGKERMGVLAGQSRFSFGVGTEVVGSALPVSGPLTFTFPPPLVDSCPSCFTPFASPVSLSKFYVRVSLSLYP